jgi:hypothetical protein
MKRIVVSMLVLIFLLCARSLSFAWSSPGHMTIAAIAYRDLTAQEKTTVSALLKSHPNYAIWKERFPTNSILDLPTYIFMQASTWPDQIRRSGSPYDHPAWHYIDYPLEPPTFPDKGSPHPNDDILFGISQCEKTLQDQSATPQVRAVYLSWLIHLVGDIHQPLHCATLVTEDYPAPVGDKGGNDFFVKVDAGSEGVNLHSLWDKGLGATVNPRLQYNNAIEISAMYSRTNLTELSHNPTPVLWSKESRMFAIQGAYLDGRLQGSKNVDNAPTLPDDYTKNLKAVALKRAALAGYRLADEIKQYVK